jgi:hypothetical protein
MNRYLATSLGAGLGLLAATGRAADNIEWHAPRSSTPPQTSNVAPAALVGKPTAGQAPALAIDESQPLPQPTPVTPDLGAPTTVFPPQQSVIVGQPGPIEWHSSHPTISENSSWVPGDESWRAPAPAAATAPKLEVTGEYLLWWSNRPNVGPPLLTTSPPNGVDGVPGAVPGARVLLNAGDVGETFRDGVRIGATWWLDGCTSYGFDGRIFFTGDRSDRVVATSNQFPNGLFRPFTAANPGLPGPFAEQITAPGATAGSFTAVNTSNFWGAEANYRDNIWCSGDCCRLFRVDLLAGFRYLHLDESLSMTEDYTRLQPLIGALAPPLPVEIAGTRVTINDTFATNNDFYGGQIGTVASYRQDRWNVDVRGSVAVGTTHETLDINGGQIRAIPGGPTLALRGGLLALPSNIGSFTRDEFAVVPEVGVTVGYQVTQHWRLFAGYNFLYWSSVIRPGDQIDPVLDVNQIPRFVPAGLTLPGVLPPRPAPQFSQSDFWAQGATLGVEFRW